MRFSQLVPWQHESVRRVFSGHQLGKPSFQIADQNCRITCVYNKNTDIIIEEYRDSSDVVFYMILYKMITTCNER